MLKLRCFGKLLIVYVLLFPFRINLVPVLELFFKLQNPRKYYFANIGETNFKSFIVCYWSTKRLFSNIC